MKYVLLSILTVILLAATQTAFAVVLESGIPGDIKTAAGTDFKGGVVQYIRYLYLFVLGFVGIAGLVTLVIWGTVWTASGVIDKKAAAMEGIKNTLYGIGTALTAYVILYTVNPDLTVIRLPSDIPPATITKFQNQQCKRSSDCPSAPNVGCFFGEKPSFALNQGGDPTNSRDYSPIQKLIGRCTTTAVAKTVCNSYTEKITCEPIHSNGCFWLPPAEPTLGAFSCRPDNLL